MSEALKALTPFALLFVLIILLLGLWNMMRGGSANRSQMLMRWRVFAQFIAVLIMVGALYFAR
jgi:hypothetical protein